ncbi:MAG: hypothetical protein KJ565_16235 [Gammaproteobacteria bacterium]|uniref:hypothetical protein n=1 Tax=Hydrogenophaga sp. TaxID=1904254 RepID=UPI0025C055FC|nr:hypothetical protein [Hydrogenophaga sp.]MBU4183239.1 hypothetical protein [Gammaproteobacteria bacterium]MBU4283126.1 hypothetical protein [Gammaproteobacteria bacterium]MBU4323478.1 hypothetical protein [Gammaproteobacteria bacterium]MCG2656515.1 hypothetical protein [Hydrogenophaga sp.]
MITESLPTIKSTESLREQLIREGKIIPIDISEISKRLDNSLRILRGIVEDSKAQRSDIEKVFLHYYEAIQRARVSFESTSSPMASNAYAFLALRKFNSLLKLVSTAKRSLVERFAVLRDGFFFAFKENKKNTP